MQLFLEVFGGPTLVIEVNAVSEEQCTRNSDRHGCFGNVAQAIHFFWLISVENRCQSTIPLADVRLNLNFDLMLFKSEES